MKKTVLFLVFCLSAIICNAQAQKWDVVSYEEYINSDTVVYFEGLHNFTLTINDDYIRLGNVTYTICNRIIDVQLGVTTIKYFVYDQNNRLNAILKYTTINGNEELEIAYYDEDEYVVYELKQHNKKHNNG